MTNSDAAAEPTDDGSSGTPQAWTAHGNDAPSRGPQVADDGMSESPSADSGKTTTPDGEQIDSGVSDGGESGQDGGSMD